jgi:MoaA/NifB/PqqE/SkfB family radical SAM enzyme
MGILESGFINLVHNTLSRSAPLYVQYYVTARCNLRCEQCNVIYANADSRELKTEEAFNVIDNLSDIGTSVVLLTGGEPFVRSDLPRLAGRLIDRGVHPRIQTNGLASEARLRECADLGVRDISISLDSLTPTVQDKLNGGFEKSWNSAINTISIVSKTLGENTFAAFGCVFSPFNFRSVPDVIEFATEIGWWVSLVPAHTTDVTNPRSFSTFNKEMNFLEKDYREIAEVLDKVRSMKRNGYNVYDSDQFLDDLERFVTKKPITWRERNDGVCDAGSLYFAVLPDGSLAPCCDWRLESNQNVGEKDFVSNFMNRKHLPEIQKIAKACSGCLYGSYPEISISARFAKASMERFSLFIAESRNKIRILNPDELTSIAERISGASDANR